MTTPSIEQPSPIRGAGDTLQEDIKTEPGLLTYLVLGVLLGIVFTKSELISWFRIQEMFRFHSFHMYGIIGSAVAVAALSVFMIKRLRLTTV